MQTLRPEWSCSPFPDSRDECGAAWNAGSAASHKRQSKGRPIISRVAMRVMTVKRQAFKMHSPLLLASRPSASVIKKAMQPHFSRSSFQLNNPAVHHPIALRPTRGNVRHAAAFTGEDGHSSRRTFQGRSPQAPRAQQRSPNPRQQHCMQVRAAANLRFDLPPTIRRIKAKTQTHLARRIITFLPMSCRVVAPSRPLLSSETPECMRKDCRAPWATDSWG